MSAYAQPRIVIIGLGVVGAALADELTLRGMKRVTVVEQGPLYVTGGSSSHAPGFVFLTNPNRVMCQLAQRTLDKLDGIELDGQWVSKRVGGLELARTPERMTELKRRHSAATAWGLQSQLLDPEQCAQLWPGLDPDVLVGGYHSPGDAVVKGVRAVEFQARRAMAAGAKIVDLTRVVGIRTKDDRVTGVEVVPVPAPADATPDVIGADIVISCAGLWGPGLARDLLGFELPMMPMAHGFGWSEDVPSLATMPDDVEVVKPMLRHQDHAMYLREWGTTIGIGAYEHRPLPVDDAQIASADEFAASGVHPAIHPFTLEDYEPTWNEAQVILPELRDIKLDMARSFNGIFSFTPDGGPMLGPVPGTEGLWLAQAIWVTQSAGMAQVVADWVTTGDPGIDTHGLDYRRFDPTIVSHDFSVERAKEAYDEVYDIVHPRAATLKLRGLRTPPWHERQKALGAVFGEANGWERALWYESNADLPRPELTQRDDWASQNWSPIAAAEAHATRTSVALFDMTSLGRIIVSGPGATEFLRGMLTSEIDKPIGQVVYAMLLDPTGGVLSDITVARLGAEEYHLGINGPLDIDWLRAHLPSDAIAIRDVTTGHCGLGLWGPLARDVLGQLTSDDISHTGFGYYKAKQIRVAGVPVLAMRLSYVGELGWELYTPAEFGGGLWDAIMAAGEAHGIVPAGRRAFEGMRLEKGYRLWGHDMTREDTPEEAGVGFAVRPAARDFVGKQALLQREVTRRLVCLTLDRVVMGGEPVWSGDQVVGYVTSADEGYTTGTCIALAWLPPELSEPGTAVEIEYFAERHRATVTVEPIFDPKMTAIRR